MRRGNSRNPDTPRVYWLTEEYFPPEVGGTGVMAACLSQGLASLGIPTQVVTRQTQPPSAPREQTGSVWVRRIAPAGRMKGAGWKALPVMLAFLARLFALLASERERYDVVICSGMKIIPLAAVPACRWLGKQVVVRLESPFELAEPISAEALGAMGRGARLIPRILKRWQLWALRRADRVIAISKDIERLLLEVAVPAERIVSIPNAIDLGRYQPTGDESRSALRQRLALPTGRTLCLYVGRLSRAKGIAMLIEAWPEIIARHPDLCLVMVGSGLGSWDDCEADVKRYVEEHSLGEHVIFLGQSDRVPEYLQAADLFVSPSEYEGFGLAVVEALASGLPSIVTAVGIAPELVQHGVNGFLFAPKHRDGMLQAFEACLARRAAWPQLGAAARQAVAPFDLAPVFDRYAELCGALAPRRAD